MAQKKTRHYKMGYDRGKKGQAPVVKNYSREQYQIDYMLGYADGYREYEAKQAQQGTLFVCGIIHDTIHVHPSESEMKSVARKIQEAMDEASKAESLKQSKVALIDASIEERLNWIDERELQVKALIRLKKALGVEPIQTRNHVRRIMDMYSHREAKAILNGHNTNCKYYRD